MNISQLAYFNNIEITESVAKRQKIEAAKETASFNNLPNELLLKLFQYLIDDFDSVMRLTLANRRLAGISDDLLHPSKRYDANQQEHQQHFQFIQDYTRFALLKLQSYPDDYILPNPTKNEIILNHFFNCILIKKNRTRLNEFEKEFIELEKMSQCTLLSIKHIKDLKGSIALFENYSLKVVNHLYCQIICKIIDKKNTFLSDYFYVDTDRLGNSLKANYSLMAARIQAKDSFIHTMGMDWDSNYWDCAKALQLISKNAYERIELYFFGYFPKKFFCSIIDKNLLSKLTFIVDDQDKSI